ncbi:Helix-turn-helix domain-containing protein, partial [Dysosmobacter welbionis]
EVGQGQFIPHAQQLVPGVVHIVVVDFGGDILAHGLVTPSCQCGLQGRGVIFADVYDLLRGDVGRQVGVCGQ